MMTGSSDESEDTEDNSDVTDDDSDDEIDENNLDLASNEFLDIPWTHSGIPRPYFPFTNTAGVQIPSLNKNNLLEIFESFFTDELINIIIEKKADGDAQENSDAVALADT
ncbi:hypothetical protein QE152_g38994 [Popillia japonica]|uniref:PiggyBac transposable element-derived protein domain-containing protein n=1 Tax=Popillia japonica TaxID=7064 RepID=A0AAW1HVC3_POPJA